MRLHDSDCSPGAAPGSPAPDAPRDHSVHQGEGGAVLSRRVSPRHAAAIRSDLRLAEDRPYRHPDHLLPVLRRGHDRHRHLGRLLSEPRYLRAVGTRQWITEATLRDTDAAQCLFLWQDRPRLVAVVARKRRAVADGRAVLPLAHTARLALDYLRLGFRAGLRSLHTVRNRAVRAHPQRPSRVIDRVADRDHPAVRLRGLLRL